eukprot:tig00021365_g20833.t1
MSQLIPAKEVCGTLAPILPAVFFIFGGLLIPRSDLPSWWKWAPYLSYFSYAHEALCINELVDFGVPGLPNFGALTLAGFGMHSTEDWYWKNVAISAGYWGVMMTLATLAAAFVRPKRAFPRMLPAPPSLDARRSVSVSVAPAPAPAFGSGEERGEKGTRAVKAPTRSRSFPKGPLPALTFSDVSYEIDAPKKGAPRRRLLAGVSGFVRGGSLTALMGSSGAGKTSRRLCRADAPPSLGSARPGRTLLDVLAGRKTVGSLAGEVRLNGRPVDPRTLPRVSSYVEQFDLLYPSMTVREAVVMSALTRLDAGLTRAAKLEAVRFEFD